MGASGAGQLEWTAQNADLLVLSSATRKNLFLGDPSKPISMDRFSFKEADHSKVNRIGVWFGTSIFSGAECVYLSGRRSRDVVAPKKDSKRKSRW